MGMTSRRTRCMTSFHAVIVVVVGLSTLVGVTGAERTLMQMQDNSEVSEWEDEEAALISGFENEFDEWEDEEAEVLSDLENEFDEMIDESVTYIEHLVMAEETLIADQGSELEAEEAEFDEMIDESVTYVEHLVMAEGTLIAMEFHPVLQTSNVDDCDSYFAQDPSYLPPWCCCYS